MLLNTKKYRLSKHLYINKKGDEFASFNLFAIFSLESETHIFVCESYKGIEMSTLKPPNSLSNNSILPP